MAINKITDQGELSRATPPKPVAENRGQHRLRRIPSATLLQGERRIIIEHEGSDYLLQLTGKGKLILTK